MVDTGNFGGTSPITPTSQPTSGGLVYSDKHAELAEKLRQDMEDLDLLQSSLARSNVLTSKMVSMLGSFDSRLNILEGSIIPIHKSTQKLTKLHENIDKTLKKVDNIISYFDLARKEEANVNTGPNAAEMGPYYETMGRIREAHIYLVSSKFRSCEKPIAQLNALLQNAVLKLEEFFKSSLTDISLPIDVSDRLYSTGDLPFPNPDQISLLSLMCSHLSDYELDYGTPGVTHIRSYYTVRSGYIIKSLEKLRANANAERKLGSYVKGSATILPYMGMMLRFLKTEREVIYKILPRTHHQECFIKTITPVIDQFLETGEGLINRVKWSISKREYGEVFVLLDVMDCMKQLLREFESVVSYAGPKGHELIDLLTSSKSTLSLFFREFYDEISKADSSKQQVLSADGTVHEVTSNTFNYLKRLLEYQDTVQTMLASMGEFWTRVNPATEAASSNDHTSIGNVNVNTSSPDFVLGSPLGPDGSVSMGTLVRKDRANRGSSATSEDIVAKYYADILDALIMNLDIKAKGYKKEPTLAILFLLNNYHYMLKTLRNNTTLMELLGKEVDIRLEKMVAKKKEEYQSSWQPLITYLSDANAAQVQKVLTKPQRKEIKDKFKSVNNDFETLCATQKAYAIPDGDLRVQIISDVKKLLVPLYARFHEKYQSVEFTKKTEKYIKFDKSSFESMIGSLFDSKA